MKIQINRQIKNSHAITIMLLALFLASELIVLQEKSLKFEEPEIVIATQKQHKILGFDVIERPKPAPVSMQKLKAQGCVADGLLSEYNPENENFVQLINRSNCYYLHRAIETWLKPPDFETVGFVMSQVTKKDLVYGMFIAEAINFRAHYVNEPKMREFNFREMCRKGSENVWGEGTCKPTFASVEYRDYIQYITEKAIDAGVQSFTFGQIYMQEGGKKDYADSIVSDMREYAKKKDVDIVIGAQTGSIDDPKYLKIFDYIEGGVGLEADGSIENGPCYSGRGGCWALLWHDNFASKAKNVLLHLDWSGIPSDDLDIFARMPAEKRAQTLERLYAKFSSQNMGFMMPYFGVLYKDNGGCNGPKKKFYSPDKSYACKDEDVINDILAGKNVNNAVSATSLADNAGT
ncbi:MAG: hypothetical protein HGA36_00315 [Candidatus Moranbacteria bacterium]|nr:hypothetical protein [Candidatus Moranbacteria bacterium]